MQAGSAVDDHQIGVSMQCGKERRHPMSAADQLKRKIRNFPTANLTARLAA
jgi:hypothetical protein